MAYEQFDVLEDILSEQAQEVLSIIAEKPGSTGSPFIILPDDHDVDIPIGESITLVIQTSNQYARASRLAGICRARLKIAEGTFKRKFKVAMGNATAKNADGREAFAYEHAGEEYQLFTLYSALVEVAEAWETATRIASESARKIYNTNDVIHKSDGIVTKYGQKHATSTESWNTY